MNCTAVSYLYFRTVHQPFGQARTVVYKQASLRPFQFLSHTLTNSTCLTTVASIQPPVQHNHNSRSPLAQTPALAFRALFLFYLHFRSSPRLLLSRALSPSARQDAEHDHARYRQAEAISHAERS